MSIHLQKFVDRVKSLEARGARDFTMSMADAKDLHADITRLLIDLQQLREGQIESKKEEVISVQITGAPFKP